MNKKNSFQNDDEKKYKALEKEEKKFSKPKKQSEESLEEFEEVKSDSSYEIYEGLDNLNSFTTKKQNKIRNFFLRLFAFQNFVNLFSKFLTKFLVLALEKDLISRKFLGKFGAKLQKLLLRILLVFQMKLLLFQFVLTILRLRVYAKILQRINKRNLSQNLSRSSEKLREVSELTKSRFSGNSEEFSKSNDFERSRDFVEPNPNQASNLKFSEISMLENQRRIQFFSAEEKKLSHDFVFKQGEHGGRDFFAFRIESSRNLASNFESQSLGILNFLIRTAKQTINLVKDYVLNYNKSQNEPGKPQDKKEFFLTNFGEEIKSSKQEKTKEDVHIFRVEKISEGQAKGSEGHGHGFGGGF